MSCGVGCRGGLDPTLLWLWHRQATAASIRPLVWEPPHAMEAALEKAKRPKKNVCIYIYIHIYNEHRCDLYIHATLFSVKVSFLEKRVSVSDSLTPLPGKAGSQP